MMKVFLFENYDNEKFLVLAQSEEEAKRAVFGEVYEYSHFDEEEMYGNEVFDTFVKEVTNSSERWYWGEEKKVPLLTAEELLTMEKSF